MTPLWIAEPEAIIADRFDRFLMRDATLGVLNTEQLGNAERALQERAHRFASTVPVDKEFLKPLVALPEMGFAPDHFDFGGYHFASRRLRASLAQPPEVVQFVDIELVRGGTDVQRQDYKWMRILARQEAMDLYQSTCQVREHFNWINGQHEFRPHDIRHFVFLDGFVPQTEILKVDELPSYVLAIDALAERVLRAGCTGLEFSDPERLFLFGPHVRRIRTATGVAEQPFGY